MLRSSVILLLGSFTLAIPVRLDQSEICVAGCQEALVAVTFGDVDPNSMTECTSNLRIKSLYMCSALYCSAKDIAAGIKIQNETCQSDVGQPLPPYSIPKNVTESDLERIAMESKNVFDEGLSVDRAVVPPREVFDLAHRTMDIWYYELDIHFLYGKAIYGYWGGIMVLATLFNLFDKIRSCSRKSLEPPNEKGLHDIRKPRSLVQNLLLRLRYITITPVTLGSHRIESYGWFRVPLLFQSIIIAGHILLLALLCAFHYPLFVGNFYWSQTSAQFWRYFADRNALLIFSTLPVLWLFGSRNNVLIWLTGWDLSTFNCFHRWIARIIIVQAIFHATGQTLRIVIPGGSAAYNSTLQEQYFRAGIAAIVAVSISLLLSTSSLRRRSYDFWLATHIVLAMAVLILLFLQEFILSFSYQSPWLTRESHMKIFPDASFNGYLWACVALWAFDRLLRVVRLVLLNSPFTKRGRMVKVSYSDGARIVRLEVPTPFWTSEIPGTYYFVYALHGWRFWESHPFTASWSVDSSHEYNTEQEVTVGDSSTELKSRQFKENNLKKASVDRHTLRFFVRPRSGFTSRLRTLASQNKPLRILIEGPYGPYASLGRYNHVLFIAGGSGITVVLHYLQRLIGLNQEPRPSIHLLWSIRQAKLLEEFTRELQLYQQELKIKISIFRTDYNSNDGESESSCIFEAKSEAIDWSVTKGRPKLETSIKDERLQYHGKLAVVSCCPPSMNDDIRRAVTYTIKATKTELSYIQESFSW